MDISLLAYFWGISSPTQESSTPDFDPQEGQWGQLKQSKVRFRVTKIDGDEITIRYQGSRQDWTGKKDELAANAILEPYDG